uniref:Uncharacterized protein n=1 Tax=Octopus bimaculoides TaxID=37653 RepID=A0A0L8GPQ9_OCTBM
MAVIIYCLLLFLRLYSPTKYSVCRGELSGLVLRRGKFLMKEVKKKTKKPNKTKRKRYRVGENTSSDRNKISKANEESVTDAPSEELAAFPGETSAENWRNVSTENIQDEESPHLTDMDSDSLSWNLDPVM